MPAEVAQFDDVGVGVKKQVLRFDVSVAHAHLVNIGQGARNWRVGAIRRGWRGGQVEGDAAYLGTCTA